MRMAPLLTNDIAKYSFMMEMMTLLTFDPGQIYESIVSTSQNASRYLNISDCGPFNLFVPIMWL